MVVGFLPGGSVLDVRVILRWDEKLPNKFNTAKAEIFREDEHNFRNMHLVKPLGQVLPADSELLAQPEEPEPSELFLTVLEEGDITFKHANIIEMEDDTDLEVDGNSA